MELLQITQSENFISPQILIVATLIFNLLVSIIGFFLISTLKELKSTIKENTGDIQNNKESIIIAQSKIDNVEKHTIDKLDDILSNVKDLKKYMYSKFEKYDEKIDEIKSGY